MGYQPPDSYSRVLEFTTMLTLTEGDIISQLTTVEDGTTERKPFAGSRG